MRGLVAVAFLGMAILFLGIAVTTGLPLAWLMAALNAVLFGLNLMIHMSNEAGREKPPHPLKVTPASQARAGAGMETDPRRVKV